MIGPRFGAAFMYAADVHGGQTRKGSTIPYLTHLMGVAALVLEDGGDEDQAIAALLHDAVEDQGGAPRLEDIRARFGDRVAGIVDGCSDTDTVPKPPWPERKQTYLQRLRSASEDVLRVALADKVHNLHAIVLDYRRLGEKLWGRFNAGKPEQLWYYRAALETFHSASFDSQLIGELERLLLELEGLANAGQPVTAFPAAT